ncbi:hypothetical protein [Romboutsia lituseburensis]|uniref:DUF3784 domain-containing protein n=1 Tax=Romboutsia lituseburensis DSM 797 TaxID=1121325 RepID=A0A1G9JF25_9FIRM|nr:hypothetical protein [Romboutsia lituseburensis]CEH33522.1 Hypothetical protein RLITU_0921 [Romboutsia lituseburensis]SDL35902.1 hypothetical protein SAMN04515677_101619 [Romboutsia lituseburensis DSM 797]
MFDIYNIGSLILTLSILYLSANKYHRLLKLERLENAGASPEEYNAYDKRLRLECILLIVIMGTATILSQFTNALTVAVFMIILGIILKIIINKCCPIPK